MTNTQISLSDILAKRDELLRSTMPAMEAFREFLSWLGAREKQLDSSATAYFDKILENAFKVARENAEKMQDSPESRRARRIIAKGEGGHVSVESMLKAFEKPHGYHSKIIDDWSAVLSKTHQAIADFVYDLNQEKEPPQYSIVLITLLYSCVDELTVAHFLGRHFYFGQANAHLRIVLESLEKIELFVEKPDWVQVWASGDWKTIHNELRPSAVRKKLGRSGFDPLYDYLSNNVHASFDSFRGRAVIDPSKERAARVFVGGTPFVHLQIFHFQFSLIVSNLLLSRLAKLFGKSLNFEEVEQTLKGAAKDLEEFNQAHLDLWAAENKLDISEMKKIFENLNS